MSRRPFRSCSFDALLTFLLLTYCFLRTSCQNETDESWDKLSRLIPTNSVYEQREKGGQAAPEDAFSRSQDESNVVRALKEDRKRVEHEETDEETYDDDEYDTETGAKTEPEDGKLAKLTREAEKPDKHAPINGETEETSRDEDYLEDPSTSQYDTYYYYDDYESSNRSRYEAIVDTDTLDYPDAEEEEEEERATAEAALKSNRKSSQNPSTDSSHPPDDGDKAPPDTSAHADEKAPGVPSSTADPEMGSSMDGSDKIYTVLGKPDGNYSEDSSILIGEAVVSVVTTKSVVNGTISVPTTASPTTTEQVMAPPSSAGTTEQPGTSATTEDTSRILASVQTSRSISGARFLVFPVVDRVEPINRGEPSEKKTSPPPESTESIIDKLDRVQSELSSGFLSGGFRTAGNTLQLDVPGERDRNSRRRFTTTGKTPVISKFVPRRYNDKRFDHASSTAKPRGETSPDNLEGLLPGDYVTKASSTPAPARSGFRWPSSAKSTTTTTETAQTKVSSTSAPAVGKTKTNVIVQDISAFLPPGYKLKKEDAGVTESSVLSDILAKSKVDISSLLPPDYNKNKNSESAKSKNASTTVKTVVTSTEKPAAAKSIQDLFATSNIDISALLPRDYAEKTKNTSVVAKEATQTEKSSTTTADVETTTKKPGGLKIVFPSRPGGRKSVHKITTPPSARADAPGAVTPKIQKGWPTRATTEFTGWPTPSTTPISIEKLLEAARTATVASMNASLVPITKEISSTTTTTTTTTTPRPTTPGICEEECEVAGTIRIIGNAAWVPELLDRNTQEWQHLANEIESEMNFIFSKSAVLNNWFKKIRIDSFSQGSILVDYFVELANLQQKVNTQELKTIFHDSLKTYNMNRWNDTGAKDSMKLGSFTIDPKYTDFIVIPKVNFPQNAEKDDRLIPQWAIAVIVVGVGGLLFIIIFGVSVLVNRQNVSKLKPSISAIYEEEVAKNITSHRSSDYSKPVHTIWTDPDVSWNDKSFESTSNKVLVEKSFQDNKKYNLYDSWRSEWNGYYYNASHASSKYGGYDSTTNLSGRHHPDYDTNF